MQHIEYVPFGEVFIEERNNKWNTPYLFNAKELDEETELYYYHARYYDSRVSVWLSTDPLQEKYPNISSYAYCALNPVKYVDPDGRNPVAVYRAYRAYRAGRAAYNAKKAADMAVLAGAAVGVTAVSNHFIDSDDAEAVQRHLVNTLIGTEATSELNKNLPPDPAWTRGQEKAGEAWADQQVINHNTNMDNNNADGSGDNKGVR